jgi:hypothetical protein
MNRRFFTRSRQEVTVSAYILIQAGNGPGPLAEKLRRIPGVVDAQDLRGPYDAIALAGADSTPGLIDEIVAEIERIPDVIHAIPAPVMGPSLDDVLPGGGPGPIGHVA